jgi:5-methylcytosine-specific restriction enzyme A
MSRIGFARGLGATCNNPNYAWSFINEDKKFVLFGAWTHHEVSRSQFIFSLDWKHDRTKRKKNGDPVKRKSFASSLDHVDRIQEEGFRLFTFRMVAANPREQGVSKIKSFERVATEKTLVAVGNDFFAVPIEENSPQLNGLQYAERPVFWEGARREIVQTVYERDRDARKVCLETHGYACCVCKFDFQQSFGDFATGFIHVHHLTMVSKRLKPYRIDPVTELCPVCPNCHAMLHRRIPPYSPQEMTQMRQTAEWKSTGVLE